MLIWGRPPFESCVGQRFVSFKFPILQFFFHRNVFWFWMHQGQGTYSLFLAQKCSAHSRAALNQRQSLFEWIRYCQYTPFSFNLLYCNNSRLSVFLQLSTTFIQPCPQGLWALGTRLYIHTVKHIFHSVDLYFFPKLAHFRCINIFN